MVLLPRKVKQIRNLQIAFGAIFLLYKMLIDTSTSWYITHEDKQYNTHATHSYNIVIIISDIYIFCICHLGRFPIKYNTWPLRTNYLGSYPWLASSTKLTSEFLSIT